MQSALEHAWIRVEEARQEPLHDLGVREFSQQQGRKAARFHLGAAALDHQERQGRLAQRHQRPEHRATLRRPHRAAQERLLRDAERTRQPQEERRDHADPLLEDLSERLIVVLARRREQVEQAHLLGVEIDDDRRQRRELVLAGRAGWRVVRAALGPRVGGAPLHHLSERGAHQFIVQIRLPHLHLRTVVAGRGERHRRRRRSHRDRQHRGRNRLVHRGRRRGRDRLERGRQPAKRVALFWMERARRGQRGRRDRRLGQIGREPQGPSQRLGLLLAVLGSLVRVLGVHGHRRHPREGRFAGRRLLRSPCFRGAFSLALHGEALKRPPREGARGDDLGGVPQLGGLVTVVSVEKRYTALAHGDGHGEDRPPRRTLEIRGQAGVDPVDAKGDAHRRAEVARLGEAARQIQGNPDASDALGLGPCAEGVSPLGQISLDDEEGRVGEELLGKIEENLEDFLAGSGLVQPLLALAQGHGAPAPPRPSGPVGATGALHPAKESLGGLGPGGVAGLLRGHRDRRGRDGRGRLRRGRGWCGRRNRHSRRRGRGVTDGTYRREPERHGAHRRRRSRRGRRDRTGRQRSPFDARERAQLSVLEGGHVVARESLSNTDTACDELAGRDAELKEEIALDLLRQGRKDRDVQGAILEAQGVKRVTEGDFPGDLAGVARREGQGPRVGGFEVVVGRERKVEGAFVILTNLFEDVAGQVAPVEHLTRHGLLNLPHGGNAALDKQGMEVLHFARGEGSAYGEDRLAGTWLTGRSRMTLKMRRGRSLPLSLAGGNSSTSKRFPRRL